MGDRLGAINISVRLDDDDDDDDDDDNRFFRSASNITYT